MCEKETRRDKLGQEVGQPSRLSLKEREKMKGKRERTEKARKRWEILAALGFSSKASLSRTRAQRWKNRKQPEKVY